MSRNPIGQRALSLLLSFALVLSIFGVDTVGAWATVSDSGGTDSADSGFMAARLALGSSNPTTLYIDMGSITIGDGTVTGTGESGTPAKPNSDGSYTIQQLGSTATTNSITVTGGTHDIYIYSLNIKSTDCAFSIAAGAKVNLYLIYHNTLQSYKGYPGIAVKDGAELTVSGGGSLKVQGGTSGAGIGGGMGDALASVDCGSVTINSGKVTAIGGATGAGIGGGCGAGSNGNGGTVTINGGTVTATGDGGGAGIGGGAEGSGGTVVINGGTVTATSISEYKEYGAGIGGGFDGNGGTVYISGGSVKASGNSAIGKGKKGSSDGTLQNKSGGSNVYLTTVTLPSQNADVVTALTLTQGGSAISYGITDMQADANGKLYLYLPANSANEKTTANITANNTAYTGYYGSVTNAGSNALKMDPVLSVNSSYTYGDAISPTVSGSASGNFRYTGKDGSATTYGPSPTSPTNCGNYTVSATPDATDSYYSKILTADFSIAQKNISGGAIAAISDCTYTGSRIQPEPSVKDGGITLVAGTDYTVSYGPNTDAGTATVIVSGINNYTGNLSKTFTIGKADASVSITTSPASGGAQTGDTVTLTATVTGVPGHSPTGVVEFYDGNTLLDADRLSANGSANYTWSNVGAGSHALKASYLSDGNYNPASSNISDFSVAKRTPKLGTAPMASPVAYGSELSKSAFTGGKMLGANNTEIPGTFEWTDSTKKVTSPGDYGVTFKPTDSKNYNQAILTAHVTVTYADPTISVTGNITDQTQWAASIPLTVTTTTYDSESAGSVSVAFKATGQTDFGAPQSLMTGITFTAGKNGTFRFTVTDGRNKTATKDVTVTQIDDTLPKAPIITDAGKYTASNWYKTSQTVSAAFTATNGCSEKLQYSLDGNKWTDGTSAAVSAEGTTTVSFRVIDALNRTGTQASVTVCIDTTAPTNLVIAYQTNPVKNILNFLTFHKFFNDTVDGTVSAQDVGSGIDTYQYEIVPDGGSLDQNKWVTSGSFSIQPDFKGTVYARAQDKVGNVSEAASDSIVTDHTKPAITVSYAYSGQKIYDSGAQIGVVVIDACAGVNQITYKVGAGAVQTVDAVSGTKTPNGHYSFSIGSLPYGDYDVVIGAVDNSNNSADAITVPVSMSSVSGVAITSAPASAEQGSTYHLGATVSGGNSPSQTVSWGLSGNQSANTKIDQGGTLTIGTDETVASLTVCAVSSAVPSVSGSVTLPVNARIFTGISVKTLPAKTIYYNGETLDVTGAVITAAYDNGTSEDIPVTSAMVSGFDGSKTGTQTLTITYNGMTTTFPVTVEEHPSSSSGGSSTPSLPTSVTDTPTNTTVNLSGATFPAWVTGVSLAVTPEAANGTPSAPGNTGGISDPQGTTVYHLVINQTSLNLIGSPFVYNIKLLDQNGNPITSFTGSITVKVAIPAGIHGTPHIFRYEEGTKTFTDLKAVVENGFLVFQTDHFSYYVIAGTGDSITLDTKDYQMPVGGQYQIGVRLTGSKAASVKVYSTNNNKAVTAARLKNSNVQVTGKGVGTAYVMIDVYDSKNHLLTHASVRVDVKTGIRPRGDSTRQIGVF
ncbi:MAG TPA: Ig-like domain repeat protein [Caproiciproducens sp.]|nr:Ig-like domain repeat protein [Caproiciproducens sp.]